MNVAEYRKSDAYRREMRRMADDMLYMGQRLFPDACRVPFADFHREMAAVHQDLTIRFVNEICARGHAKSTRAARFAPIWHIFLEDIAYGRKRRPKFVVLTSRTQDLAKAHLATIRRVILHEPAFRAHFGDWSRFLIDTKHMLELKDETLILCKGMGQQFVGLNWKGRRPTLVVCDDLEDKTNTATDESLAENFRWLVGDVEPALDPQIGRIFVIGTPKHRNCIVERLDREGSGYVSRRYSAIVDENTPAERALWEAWKPLKDLKEDRRRARARGEEPEWVQEMLCRVTGDGSDFSNIKYWEGDVEVDDTGSVFLVVRLLGGPETKGDLDLMEEQSPPLVVPVNCFLGFDPAISVSSRADAAVGCVRGFDREGRHWSVDLWSHKGAPVSEQAEAIVRLGATYKVKYTAVETTAYQEALRQRVAELCQEKGVYLTGIASKHNPRKKKTGENSRLSEMQPDFALGRVHLRASHTKLRDEALDYPNGEDNHLDAFYYSRVRSYPPLHTPEMFGAAKEMKGAPRRAAYDPKLDWQVAG